MISAKEYIIQKLREFSIIFPSAKARYENVQWDDSHYIEIKPNDFHSENASYKKWEESIVFDFFEKYPNQVISFSSDYSLSGIDTVDFEVFGNSISFIGQRLDISPNIVKFTTNSTGLPQSTNINFESIYCGNKESINSMQYSQQYSFAA